ncbi:uncharacterized protein LOC113296272 [Papaver somniferum]|uniref:uncharacterized protein LOC113296272 n=1 Tax=Papaver somniferum TaxID=3469 RepID=UPI000E6F4944|nr:uncharacterized protein LOC113296272 [Papaver somniferum]
MIRGQHNRDLTKGTDDQVLPTKVLKQFVLIRGALYFRTSGAALSRCVSKPEAHEILNRVHEESCGQTGGIPLYRRLQRMGVYWPNMAVQAAVTQDKCADCQAPPQQTEICSAEIVDWRHPYVDFLCHERLPSNRQEALKIQRKSGRFFMSEGVLYRKVFGEKVLRCLSQQEADVVMTTTHDNEHQGMRKLFLQLHEAGYYWTTMDLDTAEHAEATNKTLLKILSRMVYGHYRSWNEQLPLALWAYRISKISSTGASPYSLVYGEDATLQEEIAIPSARVAMASLTTPDDVIRNAHLDALEERRARAERFADKYRHRTTRYYNQRVKERVFSVNDVVMKIAPHVQRNESAGKFAANWQGPYIIGEAAESGYY